MNAPAFQRYPLTMRHPHERAAIISNDLMNGEGPAARTVHAPPGQPLRFPPVTVRTKEDEDYHAAQGYIAVGGGGDPAAYARATIAPVPPGYVHEEYPRIVDGQLDLGPDAPKPPDNFYPYWVRMDGYEPTLVQDAEEHAALLEKRGASSAEQSAPPMIAMVNLDIVEVSASEIELLWLEAEQLGIKRDRRWGVKKLRAAIERAGS